MKTAKNLCVLLAIAVCLVLFAGCRTETETVTVSAESYFDKLIIKNGKVYMVCSVEFVNDEDKPLNITVKGESEEDVKNGLLTDGALEFRVLNTDSVSAVSEENIEQLLEPACPLTLEANGAARYCVCFIGSHGGGEQKHDRELPRIIISIEPSADQ